MNSGLLMKNIASKILIFLLFFCIRAECSLFAQPSCIIYSDISDSDTVDFGKCIISDSLSAKFIIKNSGTQPLRIIDYAPSFVIGLHENYAKEFEEFSPETDFPINIAPNTEKSIIIKYKASSLLTVYPPGKKYAKLKLGLFNPETVPDTVKESDIVYSRTFLLIARKTTKFVDGNEEFIECDSVYKNPSDTLKIAWNIINFSNYEINLNSIYFKMLSPVAEQSEFSLKEVNLPLNLLPKRNFIWTINYYPKDTDADSCTFLCFYKSKNEAVAIEDSCFVQIKAIGVEHKLRIQKYQSGEFSADTLIFENIKPNESNELIVVIKNEGNLPYGALNQGIESISSPNGEIAFSITKPFLQNNSHLYQNKLDTLKIKFNPTEIGEHIAKCTIESDLGQRNIFGTPRTERYFSFYLKGKSSEPRVNILKDTIDFGNIVLSPECPNSRDTIIQIANLGNEELKIFTVSLNPSPPFSKFSIIQYPSHVKPNEQGQIHINFTSNSIGEERADLIITTNASQPNNKIILPLKATGVPLVLAELSLPRDIRAKPGTAISFPIIVKNSNLRYGRNFSDTLSFDKTLLSYYAFQNFETASEVADHIAIQQLADEGRLSISISVPYTTYFLPNDTLIILKFHSYLGENVSTPISFANPKVGDGICSNVLNIEKQNGLFALDSVCGLDLKVSPISKPANVLKRVYPNPAIDKINIEYVLNESSKVQIAIYNIFAEKVKEVFNAYKSEGQYIIEHSYLGLPPGFYYCVLSSNSEKSVRTFIISK